MFGDCWWLTPFGPVLSSLHSSADSFTIILGSSQDTAKYIEITIDWKRDRVGGFQGGPTAASGIIKMDWLYFWRKYIVEDCGSVKTELAFHFVHRAITNPVSKARYTFTFSFFKLKLM